MNPKNEEDQGLSFIENIAKELYGYDEANLQKEMDEAEAQWEQQKASNPNAETENLEAARHSFDLLMAKIKEEKIEPVSKEDYGRYQREGRRKVVHLKKFFKLGLLVAALYVLMSGMIFEGAAFKKLVYRKEDVGKVKNEVVWSDEKYQVEVGSLDEAYQVIGEKINIRVIKLGYKPDEMKYKGLSIEDGKAKLVFSYRDNLIYLREAKYPVSNVSEGATSDTEHSFKVFNRILKTELLAQEHKLDDGQIEYWASINFGDAYYWMAGIIDKEEFARMLEHLQYYE